MPEQIIILTGEIQSGKTSMLMEWCQNRFDVYGILTPVIDGTRFFFDIHSREQFRMEAEGVEDVLPVGRFRFSKKNFNKAVGILDQAIEKDGWLVADEIGPLELRGDGFAAIVRKIIAKRTGKIVFVVRKALIEDVVQFFELDRHRVSVINADALPS